MLLLGPSVPGMTPWIIVGLAGRHVPLNVAGWSASEHTTQPQWWTLQVSERLMLVARTGKHPNTVQEKAPVRNDYVGL